jgi:phospholipid/cholesterol/gamma-HCH transport system substrate-binding protein
MISTPNRTRRPTRRYDTEPPLRTLGRAGAVLAAFAVLGYLAVTLYSGIPGRDYRYVEATVPDPGSLIAHDPVRIGGARVGQVAKVGTSGDGQAALRLQLNPGTKLTRDTKITIRANGLLGARFVELVPGAPGPDLPAGAVIRGDSQSLSYGATEALDVLDRETRGQLGTVIRETASGVRGQGQNLNDTLRVGGDVITPSAELFRYLRAFPDANARLLPSLAAGMRPLAANRLALGSLLGTGADALAPITQERDATRATISAAPATLDAANDGLGAGTRLIHQVHLLAAAVNQILPPAPAALRTASTLLQEAPGPLKAANGLLQAAEPAIPAALKLTSGLKPVLAPLKGLTDVLKPIADELAPYRCDIENVGVVMRSMTGFGSRVPGGPAGVPMAFRLQVAPAAALETLSLPGALNRRESYPAPCTYLSKPYDVTVQRGR